MVARVDSRVTVMVVSEDDDEEEEFLPSPAAVGGLLTVVVVIAPKISIRRLTRSNTNGHNPNGIATTLSLLNDDDKRGFFALLQFSCRVPLIKSVVIAVCLPRLCG